MPKNRKWSISRASCKGIRIVWDLRMMSCFVPGHLVPLIPSSALGRHRRHASCTSLDAEKLEQVHIYTRTYARTMKSWGSTDMALQKAAGVSKTNNIRHELIASFDWKIQICKIPASFDQKYDFHSWNAFGWIFDFILKMLYEGGRSHHHASNMENDTSLIFKIVEYRR